MTPLLSCPPLPCYVAYSSSERCGAYEDNGHAVRAEMSLTSVSTKYSRTCCGIYERLLFSERRFENSICTNCQLLPARLIKCMHGAILLLASEQAQAPCEKQAASFKTGFQLHSCSSWHHLFRKPQLLNSRLGHCETEPRRKVLNPKTQWPARPAPVVATSIQSKGAAAAPARTSVNRFCASTPAISRTCSGQP